MKVVIAGSSGLIGTALASTLSARGDEVVRLVRPDSPGAGIPWDPSSGMLDPAALEGVDAVVNLAGRSIGDRRWSASEKALLTSSRIDATRVLSEAISGLTLKPGVLVNASAIGIYGDRGDEVLTEDSAAGEGFFSGLCRAWEAATGPAVEAGVRVVLLRTGIVLAPQGGALGRLLAPFGPSWLSPYRWGLGGWIGRGTQWWSWIALEDQVRAIVHLVESGIAGPVNLTSPSPVTNKAFLKAVGRALRRPVWLPIPKAVLRLVLGPELAEATLFDSQRVLPSVLLDDGFVFRAVEPDIALGNALGVRQS